MTIDFTSHDFWQDLAAKLNGWKCGDVVMSADTLGLLTGTDGDNENYT